MSVQALYQQKRMSAADAIRVVKNGDTIVVPTAVGEPPSLLNGFVRRAAGFSRCAGVADSRRAQVWLY